ncbi:MAG: hypothetical protein LBT11_02310 [Treponema sp.]|jgi:multiple sugar transport system substrate-binding protein/putative aldouronate transport system substrate-binding protein|nr:hypothetical protein [Treponema sp.]
MKKNIGKGLCIVLLCAAIVTGCSQSGAATGAGERELYRIDVYSQLANYAGMQVGWFAKLAKDKFNLELNIIPQAEGTYATRMAAGNLGDLILFGQDGLEYTNAIEAGILLDWTRNGLLDNYGKDIKANFPQALQQNRDKFGAGTAVYGFGFNVAPSVDSTDSYFYHPDIRFDLYQAIGSPPIKDLMDYLNVLKQMVDYAPNGDSGLKAYGISLFKDWDGDTVMSVKAMGAYYGYDEWGFTLYDVNSNTTQSVLDPNGYYIKGLQFFNRAYQMGILDPDSATQTFSDVTNKYADGRVYWSQFSWLGPSNYNTAERLAAGKGMFTVAAQDQKNVVYGQSVYGGNRPWAIGAKAKYPERIMELINWLSTPAGVMESNYGPQGVLWNYDANNKPYLTELGIATRGDGTVMMPESAGGGTYADGQSKMNNTTFNIDSINPISGESYNHAFWSSWLSRDPTPAFKKWQDAMGALSEDEYLEEHNFRAIAFASDFVKPGRSADLETTYTQVSTAIKNYSWQAIYARTDAEFNRLVNEMTTQAKALGFDECLAWEEEQARQRAAAVQRVRSGN